MTLNVCLGIIVWFAVPETKQIPLEQMDTLFGGVDKVEKGAVILEEKERAHGIEHKAGAEITENATATSEDKVNKIA